MLLLTLIVISTTSFLVVNIDPFQFKLKKQKQTIRALAQAKRALLGFALTYGDVKQGQMPGYLPCPDKTGNGSANPPCSKKGENVSGQLPWRTLALPPLDLDYTVSGKYKDNPKQILNNTDTKIIATIVSNTLKNDHSIKLEIKPDRFLKPVRFVSAIITPKDFEPIYQGMNDWVGEKVLQCFKQKGKKCLNDGQWKWWKIWKQKVFVKTNKILTTSTTVINLPIIVLITTKEQNNQLFNYLEAKHLDEKILTTDFELDIYY
ncbi:hypothetical protein [Candidatus Marithrix sp. Canyon 246]|uniref:hypothetical protein n=2 Tax=Candidatus Marithrix sp. Canyon 246 TaxID=1827136 RepID=UPI00114CC17C|nr:hypothetical protein [Candidatus Marithrix sp. Canyon 246]